MRSLASILPALPGIAPPIKTHTIWPAWSNSTRLEVQFSPVPKRFAMTLWHRAREFERQTRQPNRQDGALGRNGLAVLQVLIFDFLNFATGRLDPGYESIARMANISRRSVARGLAKLKTAGVLNWLRRCREGQDESGRYRLEQETNAYAVLPFSQWKGYRAPPEPPTAPESGTWGGNHPPAPDTLAQAAQERFAEAPRTVISLLEAEPDNPLARSLARFARSLAGGLLECQPGTQTVLDKSHNSGARLVGAQVM